MDSRASTRLARDDRRFGDVERGERAFAFAEDAGEGRTGEPDDVASGVHIDRDGLGV